MALKYYSKEWLDEVLEKVNNDKEYLNKTKKFNATFLTIITDCPDGNDLSILMKYDKGKVVRFEYEAKPAPASFRIENEPWNPKVSLFKSQMTYDAQKKLSLKEITLMDAMKDNLYKTEGDFVKVVALLPYIDAYMQLQESVECEF